MTKANRLIAHVVLPVPVRRHFDYLIPDNQNTGHPLDGKRVLVPFGKSRKKVGLVIGQSNLSNIQPDKLKAIESVIDETPLLNGKQLKLLQWISNYYLAPIGDLIFSSLPPILRLGHELKIKREIFWQVSATGRTTDKSSLSRAKKQLAILEFLSNLDRPSSRSELNEQFHDWRNSINELIKKDLVETIERENSHVDQQSEFIDIILNAEQQNAFELICKGMETHDRFLLDGVTGSGKTEIYIKVIQQAVEQGKQALVLVPEIGLTPHFITRFKKRINAEIVLVHSGLTDNERLQAWIKAKNGTAKVIIGTRSAVWTPMKSPGVIIVDEEHDPSYKQQEGVRYSAKDIAILRSRDEKATIILGSATPSLESLHNVEKNKLNRITLYTRVENAQPPKFKLIDLRGKKLHGALSDELIESMRQVIGDKKQVLLFQNRRGYSPVQMCHECGWIHKCDRCDIPLTFHKHLNRLLCHHCGIQRPQGDACHECSSTEIIPVGHGTERLYETLSDLFPDANILRIDRDTTRHKGAMNSFTDKILSGEIDILVGTQMLAKGHHFPNVTLVGIIDADMGLYSNDFRAGEKMGQMITQVSGRAGRASHPGTVMIQTHYPDHPLIKLLIQNDYQNFAQIQLTERKMVNLPPYIYQVLLRAEGYEIDQPLNFLRQSETKLRNITDNLEIFGPYPSPIEKRRGRYRFQLLIHSEKRSELQKYMHEWVNKLEQIKIGNKVRWSLDVDPIDLL
jgi:primosomal protein N' (replication factor Y) (superfamily II helicase)